MTINQFFAKLRASGIRFCVKKDGAIRRYGRQDVCPIAALGKTTTNGYLDAAVDLGISADLASDIAYAADNESLTPERQKIRNRLLKLTGRMK